MKQGILSFIIALSFLTVSGLAQAEVSQGGEPDASSNSVNSFSIVGIFKRIGARIEEVSQGG